MEAETELRDMFQIDCSTLLDFCDHCVWENEAFEETHGDGGAPCKRCVHWNGER
jgi:hypothetical protein